MNWNDIKNIMARKRAADDKIARTAELMKKYWTAKNASEQQEKQLAAKTASDPCLRALRRKMIAAKHASDGMDNLQRVVKLIHTVIDRNPTYKVANIVADRNVRLEKARYTEEKAVTKEEETAKDQAEKPATQQREGEPHDGEGRSVTFSDGRTVTFKSAADLPKPPKPSFLNSPNTAPEGLSAAQNANNHPTPTWTAPTAENLTQPHYDARLTQQNAAMGELNRSIKNGINPTVQNAYDPYGKDFNMSREAMIRRINMIKRQQAKDAYLRKVSGQAEQPIAPADKEINVMAERVGRLGFPRPR